MKPLRSLTAVVALSLGAWTHAHADVITDWNAITVACVQGGPTPANRVGPAGLLDIALVQAAVHDAVQAVQGRFEPYQYENKSRRGVGTPEAAAAAAAHGVLVGMYGAGNACLTSAPNPAATYAGDPALGTGAEAAAALLPLRRPTIVLPTDPFLGSNEPGQWRPTPGVTQGAGTFLAVTAPFAMKHPAQFRPAPPPRMKSWRYLHDYHEVKALGSANSTQRSPQQTEMARFWTANFFVQLNEMLRGVVDTYAADIGDKARLLALTSFAAADSQISVYEAKYLYNFWRPITAIQEGDNDGNPFTDGDAAWTPFVQTPPYPDYSSGANCLVASVGTVLQYYFGTDKLNLAVRTSAANVTVNPRTYERVSDLMREMVEARIYQGIHFRFADDIGRRQGAQIGEWTYKKHLRPLRRKH